ncbi:hypothetical protein PENARI_c001G03170 [Penicillium arizonense]|uniref:Sec39 domain-containing protein n=1 Tax=Penicillium arizonense TaxID=1835702 RepID=A0A1F5LXV4_PENAI|nr:hypothetical protein PENARI_c001G03170 [Penicillium arizonense]OGE57990.1 hypothetical protein PENARI_c001G03170 [Penicillium arizonense]
MALELSDAHAILLATILCAGGNVADLPVLQAQFPHCFPLERLLRIILTFLPESTEPSHYTSVIQKLANSSNIVPADRSLDTSAVQDLSESVARKRVRKLNLRPLQRPDEEEDVASADPLTQFIIHRAHLIDSETALQPLVLELVLPFYEHSPIIRTWLISSLLPLLRLNYEYYAHRDETISLEILESMDDQTAVNILLSLMSSEGSSMDLVNNLRGLIGPWLYGGSRSKRRRLNEAAAQNSVSFIEGTSKTQSAELAGWEHVNEWLLSRSLVDHDSVVGAFTQWDGPSDVDLGGYEEPGTQMSKEKAKELQTRYGQSGLSVVYAHADSSMAVLKGSFKVLERVAKLLDLEESSYLSSDSVLPSIYYDTDSISSTSRASLLQNALLRPTNPLTQPSPSSISFLSALLISLRILTELGHLVPCRVAANMCLHSTEEMQLAELKNVVSSTVKQPRSYQEWLSVRERLLWLRDWQAGQSEVWDEPSVYHGLFWRIPRDTVETEILKALLAAREHQLAVDLYTDSKAAPLSATQVELAAQDAIFTAYDNASNGNRTRGGMKRAYDILQAFQPHFPGSVGFKQIHALIAATHALSFYSLTLQHGVPFQPVSIRVHHDPLVLIEKVLEQNAKSYTKLDDLLSIGRNLVAAGVPTNTTAEAENEPSHQKPSEESIILTAERRITSLAIASALSSNDFGTAYSYILTRLTPPSLLSTSSPLLTTPAVPDDISWRAVYNAGRYRSTTPVNPPPTLQSQITHLSQRMELLSLALVLVPSPDPLPEILGAWRRCDEELSSLRAREQQEEDLWDTKGDTLSSVPGGFGPSDSERDAFDTEQQRAARRARARAAMSSHHEAPMGLFEVARGAALALHKNAFPLRGAADSTASGPGSNSNSKVAADGDRPLSPDSDSRVRKRDMVSNMVTGGLVSGIGWVLGADPVNK